MGLEAQASLLVAALDLNLVRLVRGAMADNQAVAKAGGALSAARATVTPADRFEPRPVHHPEPRIEPRVRIRPTPRIEPRPVHHPAPAMACDPLLPAPDGAAVEAPVPTALPPWRLPRAATPLPAGPHVVKVRVYRPDVISKGALLDYFL